MIRAAQIENGVVVNVIVLPADFTGDEWDGLAVVPTDEAGPGWTYDGENLYCPPEPEPVPEPE